ncbi:autotransporter domain-containing protein [Castellaniella hirudinis]|uniref:Autotransporter domain-containing protein n=1 Tax=Castellaniella hirudinis TaxID=1144617 RepID=A0ABV8S061_9BURK
MNRVFRVIFNRTLGVWQVVSEMAGGCGKGGRAKNASAMLLSVVLAGAAHADVIDHGDGNFTVSGSTAPAFPYDAGGGSVSTPTITVDGTTDLTYSSFNNPLFRIGGPDNYVVNVAAGASIKNSAAVAVAYPVFIATTPGSLTTYNIAGELVSATDVISAFAAGEPRWDITLSGTLRNTTVNTLLTGQGGADRLTLQSTGTLASANGYISLRGGNDAFIVNGGTFSGLSFVDFGDGDDLLELNASPTGTTRMLGGNGTDTVQLSNSGSFSLTALESGWEHLVMNGTAWTLSGSTANTFSGGVALNSGALTLDITDGNTTTIAGGLSGSGDLTKTGLGVLALAGDSSAFDGTARLQAGTLVLDGILRGTIEAYGDSVLDAAVADAIGGFTQQSFNDNSTLNAKADGAISGGLQEFWGTSRLNAGATDAIVGGMQVFNDNSVLNASAARAIADSSQEFNDDSILNATANGAIGGGWQDFYGNSTLNASAVNAIADGEQYFEGTSRLNAQSAHAISGGMQTFYEASTLNVLATNALAETTDIRFVKMGGSPSSGILRLNGFSTTIGRITSLGGSAGLITNDGVTDSILSVDSSAGASSFSGIIQDGSGAGTLGLALSAGNLTLSGTNTYTGGTTVNGGRLVAGSAGGFVDHTAYVVNGGTLDLAGHHLTMSSLSGTGGTVALGGAALTIDQAGGGSFGGALSGPGSLFKSGAGAWMLTGDSSAFTGTTTVNGGTLSVNGALGGSMTTTAGSVLGGTGTIGSAGSLLWIGPGAVHAPGNSIGVQHIAGDYANHGMLRIEATPTAADQIVVGGAVDITGATLDLVLSPTDPSGWTALAGPFTIIDKQSVGAVTGRFNPITQNLLFLDTLINYAGGDGNDVTLQLMRNNLDFAQVGDTRNQSAAARGIESLGSTSAIWRSVALATDPAATRQAFDQLSGEVHASARTTLIEDSRFLRQAVNDRLLAAFDRTGAGADPVVTYADGRPTPVSADSDRPVFWGRGFGAWDRTGSDGNAASLSRKTNGFFVGADASVSRHGRVGVIAGISSTHFNAQDRLSSGSDDNYHLGLYGGTAWGNLALRAGAAYTLHDLSTHRSIALPGLADRLKGDYTAHTTQVFSELGYQIQAGRIALEPFGSLAHVNVRTDGFTEQGGAAALTGDSGRTRATFSTVGLRASTHVDLNGATVTAKGTIGWRHALGDRTPDAAMRFAGGDAFTISGAPIGRDTAVIGAGLDYALSPNATLGIAYDGQFGSGVSGQSVRADFNVRF